MKSVFFALAFMLIGFFGFANVGNESSLRNSKYKVTESSVRDGGHSFLSIGGLYFEKPSCTVSIEIYIDGELYASVTTWSSGVYKLLDRYKFKRSDIRDEEWKTVNITFDGDWDMHEYNQQIVLFAFRYSGYGTSTAEGTVSIGYDEETKQYVDEARITTSFSTSESRTRLKYNNSISRRDALSHIVGNFGAGTKSDGGVFYTVRTADALEYYFKHHLTKISE